MQESREESKEMGYIFINEKLGVWPSFYREKGE